MGRGLANPPRIRRSKSFDDLNPSADVKESDSKQVIKTDRLISDYYLQPLRNCLALWPAANGRRP